MKQNFSRHYVDLLGYIDTAEGRLACVSHPRERERDSVDREGADEATQGVCA